MIASHDEAGIPFEPHVAVLLNLDADERMTPELAKEIRAVLADPNPRKDAYAISFQTYFMGHLLRYSSWNNAAIRLVRRGKGRYIARRVHESMHVEPDRVGQGEPTAGERRRDGRDLDPQVVLHPPLLVHAHAERRPGLLQIRHAGRTLVPLRGKERKLVRIRGVIGASPASRSRLSPNALRVTS